MRSLHFDYSTPVALATVPLATPNTTTYLTWLVSLLHFPVALPRLYPSSSSHTAGHQDHRSHQYYQYQYQQQGQWGYAGQGAPAGAQPPPTAVQPKLTVLLPGQQVAVHVQLTLPPEHTDLFQLTGELLTEGGEVAAQATRTHLPRPRAGLMRSVRYLALAPCFMVGYCTDEQTITVRLFDRCGSPWLVIQLLVVVGWLTAGE